MRGFLAEITLVSVEQCVRSDLLDLIARSEKVEENVQIDAMFSKI